MYQRSGLPDIVGSYEGRFVAFEVKLPGKEDTLTHLQEFMLSELRKTGAIAEMVTSPEQALEYLEEQM